MKEIVSTQRFTEVIGKMADIARNEGRRFVLNDTLVDMVSISEQNEEEMFCSAWIVREYGCEIAHFFSTLEKKVIYWKKEIHDVYLIRKAEGRYQMVVLSEDEWKDRESLSNSFYGFMMRNNE